jgi:type IV pilus assembly protein PilV
MNTFSRQAKQSGFSLLEILITMLITLIALLGIALLQAKAQQAEMESYQRAQALILMSDIVDRININRATSSCFVITTNTAVGTPYLGVGGTTPAACAASTTNYNNQADAALVEIDDLLEGTAEKVGTANTGSVIGGKACISYDSTTELDGVSGTGLYTVVVSWQALGDLAPPVANCANNTYGAETKRRSVSTSFRIANLYG